MEAGGYSGNALKWTWASAATSPTGFTTIRNNLSAPTDEFLIEYYMKFDTGWQGSGQAYHPHLIHLLEAGSTAYQSLNTNDSSLYFEAQSDTSSPYNNHVTIEYQDTLRVNTDHGTPPQDLTNTTETRSATQCNTPYTSSGATNYDCYSDGGYYHSSNEWKATATITENTWVKIQTYIKKNTFTAGVGNFDGIIKSWVDGTLVIDKTEVLFAANAYSDTEWRQIVLAPYIGDGAPISESMWIDELGVWSVAHGSSLGGNSHFNNIGSGGSTINFN